MADNRIARHELRTLFWECTLRCNLACWHCGSDGFAEDHTYIRGNEHCFARASEAIRRIAGDGSLAWDVMTCVTTRSLPRLGEFKEYLISLGVKSWRLATIFPVGRAAEDPQLQLTDEEFTALLDFIRQTRKERRIDVSFGCEGFLGDYEGDVRSTLYHCDAGVSVASILIDGSISGCTSIRSNFHPGNIYRDDFHEVWENGFRQFRDRSWAHKDQCGDCSMFRYCRGNGMHLYDNNAKLLVCHYHRLPE